MYRTHILMRDINGGGLGPFHGSAAVFRYHCRGRRRGQIAAEAACLLVGLLALSAALRQFVFGPVVGDAARAGGVLQPWVMPAAAAIVLLLSAYAAGMGAGAAPAMGEAEAVESALLTRLSHFDICTGRLLGSLASPLAVVAMSCLFWLAAQAAGGVVRTGSAGVLVAHLVLLSVVMAAGSVSLLFALRGDPGRARGRGMAVALTFAAAGVGALFAANPVLHLVRDPSRLIKMTLAINPVYAVETALGKDILRAAWVYDHTGAADFAFVSPAPLASAALFTAVALLAHALSVARLRRAYQ